MVSPGFPCSWAGVIFFWPSVSLPRANLIGVGDSANILMFQEMDHYHECWASLSEPFSQILSQPRRAEPCATLHICFLTVDHHGLESGGGIASYLATLSAALADLGHRVTIICADRGRGGWDEEGNPRILRIRLGNAHYYLSKLPLLRRVFTLPLREGEWSFAFWRALKRLQRRDPIDLVESGECGNLFGLWFFHDCPWVIRAHGATYWFRKFSGESVGLSERWDRALQRRCMRMAAGLSAPSGFQARMIESELKGVRSVNAIPNPVDRHFIETSTEEGEEDALEPGFLLYAGRMERRKGTLVLLGAMAKIVAVRPETRLVIAGDRHRSINEADLRSYLKNEALARRIHLLGHVPWTRLRRLYRACALVVMPSFYETFCITAVEAMAMGKAVVGATCTALPEIIAEGETGLLVPPGDEDALATAVLTLLDDPERATRMGAAGRTLVRARFEASRVAETTQVFYQRVCQAWRGEQAI